MIDPYRSNSYRRCNRGQAAPKPKAEVERLDRNFDMDGIGNPLSLEQAGVTLRDVAKVWSQMASVELLPKQQITIEATQSEVHDFLRNNLSHLHGQTVAVSIAGSWKLYSQFQLETFLQNIVGEPTAEFTEFMLTGIDESEYLSVQQEEYFIGIFTVTR